jgi:ADP-heptose:LPS heptosyltransferase
MRTIFHVTGGLGKHVVASGVINSYKSFNKEEDIIVCSAYPEVFSFNSNVKESLDINTLQYFYKNYISNKDVKIFAQEPYKQASHILKQKSLIETWCEMVGVEHYMQPSIDINFREKELISRRIPTNKPILIFQPFGGNNTALPYNWARDIHPMIAQSIVNMLADKYHVVHICNPYHPVLNNCQRIDERLGFASLAALVELSNERFLIDSSIQHIAFALNKPSTVIWNVTSPIQFGYNNLHNNITSPVDYSEGHRKSYLFDFEIGGIPSECPVVDYTDMYDMDKILSSIKTLLNDK